MGRMGTALTPTCSTSLRLGPLDVPLRRVGDSVMPLVVGSLGTWVAEGGSYEHECPEA